MIILEKPYVSEFLIDTIVKNDITVLENESIKNSGIEEGALKLITSQEAKTMYEAQEYPKIYANSENAISWVQENLPESSISDYIKLFKDKTAFRELLKELYPNFYFRAIDFQELKNLTCDAIKYPVVIKPAVGFLSFGVHTAKDDSEWKYAIAQLEKEMENAMQLYPGNVVNFSKFIIEDMIEGEEFAIDAYYDNNGEPVILNIFQHPFLNSKDVSDRIYLMSATIMIKYMAKFSVLLHQIGNLKNIRNFPLHIEVRVTDEGEIVPIEINPMRFAGWCTTDVAKYAWGVNVYEHFFNNERPDWNSILEKAEKEVFYFSMAEVPSEMERTKIMGFNYEKFLANYSNVLEVRRIDPQKNPLFAVIFGSTTNREEVLNILRLKTRDYVIS